MLKPRTPKSLFIAGLCGNSSHACSVKLKRDYREHAASKDSTTTCTMHMRRMHHFLWGDCMGIDIRAVSQTTQPSLGSGSHDNHARVCSEGTSSVPMHRRKRITPACSDALLVHSVTHSMCAVESRAHVHMSTHCLVAQLLHKRTCQLVSSLYKASGLLAPCNLTLYPWWRRSSLWLEADAMAMQSSGAKRPPCGRSADAEASAGRRKNVARVENVGSVASRG